MPTEEVTDSLAWKDKYMKKIEKCRRNQSGSDCESSYDYHKLMEILEEAIDSVLNNR